MRVKTAAAVGIALVAATGLAIADKSDNPWAEADKPSATEKPQSIGGYSAGCVDGAEELPLDGTGYHVARPARGKHFGHPNLIDFVKDLGKSVRKGGLGAIVIGDLGQPRGGPSPSGHSSHQSGLDVDIWFWHPKWLVKKNKLTKKQRAKLSAHSVISSKKKNKSKYWSSKVARVLKLAASDDRVARIFVNPIIKKQLCTSLEEDERGWLRKLRPWWGHDSHFHVRLECPKRSTDCESQSAIAAGDGCEEIDWWLDDDAQAERKKRRKKYRKKVGAVPELPARCKDVIGENH